MEPARRLVGQLVEQTGAVARCRRHARHRPPTCPEALAASATDDHPAFADITEAREHLPASELCSEHEDLIRRWTTEKDRLEEKAGQAAVKAGLKLLDDGVEAPTQETINGAHEAQRAAEAQLSDANREHGSIQATHTQCRTQQAALLEVSRRSAEQLAEYEEPSARVTWWRVVAKRREHAITLLCIGRVARLPQRFRTTHRDDRGRQNSNMPGQGGRGHAGLNLRSSTTSTILFGHLRPCLVEKRLWRP